MFKGTASAVSRVPLLIDHQAARSVAGAAVVAAAAAAASLCHAALSWGVRARLAQRHTHWVKTHCPHAQLRQVQVVVVERHPAMATWGPAQLQRVASQQRLRYSTTGL